MNRTLIAVLSTVALVLAVPSFAGNKEQPLQPMPASSAEAASGGAPAPVAEQARVPAGEKVATGDVVMSTPDELVVHTSSGMRRFDITPATQMYEGAAEGDVVTVFYKPEAGSVKVVSVKRIAVSKRSQITPAKAAKSMAKTTTHTHAGMSNAKAAAAPMAASNPKPAMMHMAQVQKPAASTKATTSQASTQPAKRLPKTASDLPLVGLTGLLSLVGAVTLRATRG